MRADDEHRTAGEAGRHSDGGTRRNGRRAVAVGAVLGAALAPAGAAHANIIGIGNAAFGNDCVQRGDARAAGGTVAGSGAVSGNQAGLPLSLPRNQCGNSGIVCTALFRSSV
ncbi:chaplin family protein [Streptomyces sp. NPDC020965]|uniref:chaplin family protein n=1 Tax=Streptomyces sp. NPDC020965 TaxID=3365105 RepID=UPI003788F0D4